MSQIPFKNPYVLGIEQPDKIEEEINPSKR